LIESVLASEESVLALDARLRQGGASLRCVAREIPVVFGEWFSYTQRRIFLRTTDENMLTGGCESK